MHYPRLPLNLVKMDGSILFAVAICFFVIFLIQRLLFGRKYPPGPIGLPFVGYLPFLSRKPYLDLQRIAKKYGNVFSLRLGSMNVVILNDFESTKEAFGKDAFIGRPDDLSVKVNKITVELKAIFGLPWKEQRKFSLHQLRDLGLGKSKMEGHIQDEIDELLNLIERNSDRPFCIYEVLAPSMSNNISSLMFGKRLKYDDPARKMMTRSIKDIGSIAGQSAWHLFFPWVKKICKFLNIADIDKIDRVQQDLREYVWKEINEHEKTLDPSNIRDFIDGYLVEMKNRKEPTFCKEVLQDLAVGFFVAGSETVRLTVEWSMLTLAVHQDTQRRIHREIDETVGKNQPVMWLDHKRMPFTEACIMEIMRWKPVIPLNILRAAIADGEIKGYFIPKGTVLMSNLWAIHYDPEYWGKDADQFRPERFLTDDGQAVKKWERFSPFSIGKRQCPGEPMAKVEIFKYFVSIMQKFHVKLPEGKVADFEGDLGIGLMPKPQELIFSKRS